MTLRRPPSTNTAVLQLVYRAFTALNAAALLIDGSTDLLANQVRVVASRVSGLEPKAAEDAAFLMLLAEASEALTALDRLLDELPRTSLYYEGWRRILAELDQGLAALQAAIT